MLMVNDLYYLHITYTNIFPGITIFFNPIQYNVTEGNTDVTVTLRAQTSQALLTSSSIRIRDQSVTATSNNFSSQQITNDVFHRWHGLCIF